MVVDAGVADVLEGEVGEAGGGVGGGEVAALDFGEEFEERGGVHRLAGRIEVEWRIAVRFANAHLSAMILREDGAPKLARADGSLLLLEVGGGGGLDDEFDGDCVERGGGATVFELGGGVEDFAVEGADLDADVSVGGGDGGVSTVDAGALLAVDADAEGGGLGEEEAFEGGGVSVVGEDGDEGAETAFFHGDGGEHDVERAKGEGGFGDVGDDLRGEIVEGGFEDGDGVGGVFGSLVGFAEGEAEDVGEVFGVAGACAVADVLDAHGGLRAEGGVEGADESGTGGGDQFLFDMGGVGGESAEQVGGGGRGDGEAAVGAIDHAATDVERGGVPAVDVERVDSGAGGNDIDDGIDGADFVEVDFFDVDVMDFGFGGAEEFEGVDGGLLDGSGEAGGLDEGADGGEGATVGVWLACFMFVLGLRLVGVGVLVGLIQDGILGG